MKLSLEEKTRLKKLSEKCSELLVDIIDSEIPFLPISTEKDAQFIQAISQMHSICPSLSDSYVLMYNRIQRAKREGDKPYKRISKIDYSNLVN